MLTWPLITFSFYLIITFCFAIAIQYERVKQNLEINSLQIFISPLWPIIAIWYLIFIINKKTKG